MNINYTRPSYSAFYPNKAGAMGGNRPGPITIMYVTILSYQLGPGCMTIYVVDQ